MKIEENMSQHKQFCKNNVFKDSQSKLIFLSINWIQKKINSLNPKYFLIWSFIYRIYKIKMGRRRRNYGYTYSNIAPCIVDGVYLYSGQQINLRSLIDQPHNRLLEQGTIHQQQQQQHLLLQQQQRQQQFPNLSSQQISPSIQPINPQQPIPVRQINITLIGNQVNKSDSCCLVLTILLGVFTIVPFFFMCCTWWKKKVFPMYKLTPQVYRDIGTLFKKFDTAKTLTLTVFDNMFNAEKSKILYDIVSSGHLTAITFVNHAPAISGQFNETDDFQNNMLPIKSLPNVSSYIKWDSMIV